MNLSELSWKVTDNLTAELNYTEEKKEIVAYAIETALLSGLGMAFIVLLGLLLNALWPAVIAALFGGSLRRLSGGAHFKTPLRCLSFGAIAYSFLGLFAQKLVSWGLFSHYLATGFLFLSFVIVFILAPVDSLAKPIHSSRLRIRLKGLSLIFIFLTFVITYVLDKPFFTMSAALGVFAQSITLLPIFNRRR